MVRKDVVILGAGLSGLVVADLLCKEGLTVTVLESSDKVGGLAKTFTFNDFKFDLGGHRLCFSNNLWMNYIMSFAKSKFIVKKRKSAIFLKGKYLNYPPRLLNCFQHDFVDIFKIVYDYINLPLSKEKQTSESLKTWVVSKFGQTIHDIYFRNYSRKVWGLDTDMISSSLANKRMDKLSSALMIKEMFTRDSQVKENIRYFYYPIEGIGSISRDLKDSIENNKGEVVFNVRLKHLFSANNNLNSLIYQKGREIVKVDFSSFVSTIPLLNLVESAFYNDNNKINNLSKLLKYRDLILVFLIIEKKHVFYKQWVYFPDSNIPFARIAEPKNWSSSMVKDNKTSLCVEIFCHANDNYWNKSDDDLIKVTIHALQTIDIIDRTDVIKSFVERIPYAYPLMYLGYENDLQTLSGEFSKFKNLSLCGRNGTHSYYDMEECLADAHQTALKLKENFNFSYV